MFLPYCKLNFRAGYGCRGAAAAAAVVKVLRRLCHAVMVAFHVIRKNGFRFEYSTTPTGLFEAFSSAHASAKTFVRTFIVTVGADTRLGKVYSGRGECYFLFRGGGGG